MSAACEPVMQMCLLQYDTAQSRVHNPQHARPPLLTLCKGNISYDNAAVMIAIEYTSVAVHPRERSLIGELSPNRIGPYASKLPILCAILYPILPALISGKMNVLAYPATGESGHFVRATSGETAASN